jgi:hypothetical protein
MESHSTPNRISRWTLHARGTAQGMLAKGIWLMKPCRTQDRECARPIQSHSQYDQSMAKVNKDIFL